MSQYITTHDSKGTPTFSTQIPPPRHVLADNPSMTMEIIYATHATPPDLSTDADIARYAHEREHGLGAGVIVPPQGFSAAIITFQPQASSPVHRTMTLDTLYVLEGELELYLGDSGPGEADEQQQQQRRTLRAGDSIVQRGTLHWWKNVTPNNGVAKLYSTAIPIVTPLEVGGRKLEQEWRMG